jgi:hypothetical protein
MVRHSGIKYGQIGAHQAQVVVPEFRHANARAREAQGSEYSARRSIDGHPMPSSGNFAGMAEYVNSFNDLGMAFLKRLHEVGRGNGYRIGLTLRSGVKGINLATERGNWRSAQFCRLGIS